MVKIIRTEAEKALAEIGGQKAKLQRLETEKARAETELAALEQRSGLEVLDDETAGPRIIREMRELRDRIELASRAIVAQRPRVKAAESAYLSAEADALERPVVAAKAALQRHEERTAALLRQLEEHECPYVSEFDYVMDGRGTGGPRTFTTPKSWKLRDAVTRAEQPVKILRAMAAGEEPVVELLKGQTPADVYPPAVWGPSAVVPAAAYLREVQSAQKNRDSIGARRAELEAKVEDRRANPSLAKEGDSGKSARRSLQEAEHNLATFLAQNADRLEAADAVLSVEQTAS